MGLLERIFNKIIGAWRSAKPAHARNSPHNLDAETLEKALKEARFLCTQDVKVTALNPGELPGLPKRADL